MLVPGSLAIIAATFHPDDRGQAIGTWSGLAGIASSIGPFVGGWMIDAASWRLVFFINVPLAAVAAWIAVRHVPETRSSAQTPLDLRGAVDRDRRPDVHLVRRDRARRHDLADRRRARSRGPDRVRPGRACP